MKRGRPSGKSPPPKPGVYRFVDRETGAVDYVGETADLRRRRRQHLADGKLDEATHEFRWQRADGRSSSRTRRRDERRLIAKHQPKLNRNRGGGGPTAKRKRR